MPYARPTLSQLTQQVAANIDAALPGVDSRLRFSNLQVLGKVLAGGLWGQYGYFDWLALQAVPFTATDEYLEAWAALKGVVRKASASAAGVLSFTGLADTVIPHGTPVVRSDGYPFVTTADAAVSGLGQALAPIAAVLSTGEPAGSAWNTDIGVSMTLGTVVAGVSSTGVVSTAVIGGTDVETDDELRARMLQAYSQPPQGGATADYVEWATAVPGVTRAWCFPLERGAGTVVVRFMMDDVHADTGGFPVGSNGVATAEARDVDATGDQLTVANALYPLRPVTALVYAVAPLANVVAFTISGLSAAGAGTQAAVAAAIAGILLQEGSPGGVVAVSLIEGAIAAVSATQGFVITAITPAHGAASPGVAGNITSNVGYLPTLGAITWA